MLPAGVVAREVLMHGLVDAAVEGQVVLVALEAREGAEYSRRSWFFVDPGFDREVEHGFHFAGADLGDGCLGEGRR